VGLAGATCGLSVGDLELELVGDDSLGVGSMVNSGRDGEDEAGCCLDRIITLQKLSVRHFMDTRICAGMRPRRVSRARVQLTAELVELGQDLVLRLEF
jgi:hypothetical protein